MKLDRVMVHVGDARQLRRLASWLEEVGRRTATKRKEIVVSSPEEVLSYWFPEEDIFNADQQTLGRQMQWWFQEGPEVDTEISERFGQVLEQARRGRARPLGPHGARETGA